MNTPKKSKRRMRRLNLDCPQPGEDVDSILAPSLMPNTSTPICTVSQPTDVSPCDTSDCLATPLPSTHNTSILAHDHGYSRPITLPDKHIIPVQTSSLSILKTTGLKNNADYKTVSTEKSEILAGLCEATSYVHKSTNRELAHTGTILMDNKSISAIVRRTILNDIHVQCVELCSKLTPSVLRSCTRVHDLTQRDLFLLIFEEMKLR